MPVKTPLFFLSSSYNELNIFFPSFCSAKVKQNNFLIKLFLHQNISSFWNKQFISRQTYKKQKRMKDQLHLYHQLPSSRIASDGDTSGTWAPGSGPSSAWRGFNLHLLWNELATVHCHSLSLLTADVLVFIKMCFRAVNIEETHIGIFFYPDG